MNEGILVKAHTNKGVSVEAPENEGVSTEAPAHDEVSVEASTLCKVMTNILINNLLFSKGSIPHLKIMVII